MYSVQFRHKLSSLERVSTYWRHGQKLTSGRYRTDGLHLWEQSRLFGVTREPIPLIMQKIAVSYNPILLLKLEGVAHQTLDALSYEGLEILKSPDLACRADGRKCDHRRIYQKRTYTQDLRPV